VTDSIMTSGNWKTVTTVTEATDCIDRGVLINSQEVCTLRTHLNTKSETEIIRHYARRLAAQGGDIHHAKIIVESVIVWLTGAGTEKLMHTFLEEFCAQRGSDEASWLLVDLALGHAQVDSDEADALLETAVAIICELGLTFRDYNRAYPGELHEVDDFLEHVANALITIQDTQNMSIKLCLFHFFALYEHGHDHHAFISRFMSRFGRSVLDHLLNLVFEHEDDTTARQFLIENLTYVLGSDAASQRIVAASFDHFMMKNPELCAEFMRQLGDALSSLDDPNFNHAAQSFTRHLTALLATIPDEDQPQSARDLISTILMFQHWSCFQDCVASMRQDKSIPRHFVIFLERALIEMDKTQQSANDKVIPLHLSKRRRRQLLNARSTWSQHTDERCVRCMRCCG